MPQDPPQIALSQPKDKSLEAFKEFINAMADHLAPSSKDREELSEQDWIEMWKAYRDQSE
jgi:hypothetical protein